MSVYYFLYLFFVLVSLLLPGYVLVTTTKLLHKHPGLELCFGYLTSVLFFAGLAMVVYVFDAPEVLVQTVFWFALLLSAVVFGYQKLYRRLRSEWLPLLALMLTTLLSVSFIGLSMSAPATIIADPAPQPNRNYNVLPVRVLNIAQTLALDNYIPYRQAQFFANRSNPGKDSFIAEWGVHFFQRTPLMGAVTAQYFMALNDTVPINALWDAPTRDVDNTYAKFQVIAQALNALLVVPAFYLLAKLFNRRAAALALCFIVPSQFFLYSAFFSWPKSMVVFFILVSWLCLLEKKLRFVILAGIAAGTAYLTHDLALLYIGASALLLLYQRRFWHLVWFGGVTVVFMIPWLLISTVLYKRPSSFILYPLSVHDIPQPEKRSEIIHDFLHTSPIRLIAIRLDSLVFMLSPYQLIWGTVGEAFNRRIWGLGLFSVPGAVGAGLVIPAVCMAIKKIHDVAFWILALVPVLLAAVVIGWPHGLSAMHFAQGTVILFMGLGCQWLLGKHWRWSLVAFAASLVQLVFFISYSYHGQTSVWFHHRGDLLRLLIMTTVVAACAVGAYHIAAKTPVAKQLRLL